ncbi:hypothetical protein Trydic_g19082 [Trypoxylus dichotomus]
MRIRPSGGLNRKCICFTDIAINGSERYGRKCIRISVDTINIVDDSISNHGELLPTVASAPLPTGRDIANNLTNQPPRAVINVELRKAMKVAEEELATPEEVMRCRTTTFA